MQATQQEQYIEFIIANQQYAIAIKNIHEIIKMQELTKIPNVLPYVMGVINLRGKIVPVISLRQLFNIPVDEFNKHTRIIVVHHLQDTVGIVVDRVNKVATFSDIQAPPDRIGTTNGDLFVGVGVSDNGLSGILKLDEVLLNK